MNVDIQNTEFMCTYTRYRASASNRKKLVKLQANRAKTAKASYEP